MGRSLVARRAVLRPQSLMDELANSGVRHNINDVVFVVRRPNGVHYMQPGNNLLWLETGNANSGMMHILQDGRVGDFSRIGIPRDQIVNTLHRAIQSPPVGHGRRWNPGTNRWDLYSDFLVDGRVIRIAHGDNGFIVTAYPQ